MNRKLLIICGPTATGKTGLALELAEKFNGELISCDSRQVYKYMDVVTGKDIPENFKYQISNIKYSGLQIGYYSESGLEVLAPGTHPPRHHTPTSAKLRGPLNRGQRGTPSRGHIRIWGYDLVRPGQEFNVSLYLEFVNQVVSEIWKEDKLPIVVGGTGYFLQSILKSPETVGVPANKFLRKELEGKSVEELLELLKKIDAKKVMQMNESDRRNPRRLVRAIEVAKEKLKIKNEKFKVNFFRSSKIGPEICHPELVSGSSETIPRMLNQVQHDMIAEADCVWIGLTMKDRQRLYRRIDERVEERLLPDSGLEDELEYLLEKDYLSYAPAVTLGYQQLIEWMGGEVNLEEAIQRWKFVEHGYARRQLTWFKKMKEIEWFNVDEGGWKEKIVKLVKDWYTRK